MDLEVQLLWLRLKDRRCPGWFVEDVVVIWAEEKVYERFGSAWVWVWSVHRKPVGIDLTSRAAIQVGYLYDEAHGFEEDLDKQVDTDLLDLAICGLYHSKTVSSDTSFVQEALVLCGVSFQPRGC